MTLDDFFTLAEMNNGLTAPSRIRELMAIMQKERACIVKNSADSTRQWSAVASAIAATGNKECLNLFIQLDGLHFMSKWLKDAQNFSNESADSFVEESISLLLRALKKLPVECEKLVASEIWETVQDLILHNSAKVRDEAQALSESWKSNRGCSSAISDVEKSRTLLDDEAAKSVDQERDAAHKSSVGDDSISNETSKEKNNETTKDDEMLSMNPDTGCTSQVQSAKDLDRKLDPPVTKNPSHQIGSPSLPIFTMEPSCHSVGTANKPCCPAVSRLGMVDTHKETHDFNSPSFKKQSPTTESTPHKLGLVEESKPSEDRILGSGSDAVEEMKTAVEGSSPKASVAGENSSGNELLSSIDDSSDKKVTDDGDNFNRRMLPKAASCDKIQGNTKDLGPLLSRSKSDVKASTPGKKNGDLVSNYNFGKKQISRKSDQADKKSSLEMDYGISDPLEVARQVAIEVEREVVDSGEHSEGSEKLPDNNMQKSNSPDCMNVKQSYEEETSDPNLLDESSPMQPDSATSSENLDTEEANDRKGEAISEISEATQAETNLEKGLCDFDLNEEFHSEDVDHPGNQSLTPISIVSASRAAAAPGLPGAPLQFEGNLGWKGSAATSAFRRASPRRMPENDKDPCAGRNGGSSKQQVCLDIDLNVGESVVTREGNTSTVKHGNIFPSLASGESSAETNSRRAEHLELDLNCASQDGGTPSEWRIQQFFPQGNQSQGSSSSQQLPIRNINLNDQPPFVSDSSDNCHLSMASQSNKVSGNIKSDDSVISIMGTRVEINRKDFVSPTPSFPNGRTPELAFDVNLGRSGGFLGIGSALPYTHHSSVYGYNNIAPTPAPAMPFSSTIYGSAGSFPTPYMVDSRGAPVIPQIMGSASPLPGGFSQPPFVINMNGFNPPNGIWPLQGSFDMNSGIVESGSKDPAGFGLFLNSTQGHSADEQLRSHSQPSMNSALSGKRKEPENGFEQYPFRPYMPPWKHS